MPSSPNREQQKYMMNDNSIEGSYQSRKNRTTRGSLTTDNYAVNPALYGWHSTINARNQRNTSTTKKFNHAMKQRRRSSFNSTRDLRAAIQKANRPPITSSTATNNYATAVARRANRPNRRQQIERSSSFNDLTANNNEMEDGSSTGKIFRAMFGVSTNKKNCDDCDDLEKDVSHRSTKERVKAIFNMSFSRNDDDEEDAYDYTRRRDSEDDDSLDESFSTTRDRILSMFKGQKQSNNDSDSALGLSSPTRTTAKATRTLKNMFSGKRSSEIEDEENDILFSYAICKGISQWD